MRWNWEHNSLCGDILQWYWMWLCPHTDTFGLEDQLSV
jgi:hypothetical protein